MSAACLHPEREIVTRIATRWRDLLGFAAGDIGQIVVTQAIDDPSSLGTPLSAHSSRDAKTLYNASKSCGAAWSNGLRSCSGASRMGKSSILQNLGRYRFGADTPLLTATCSAWGVRAYGRTAIRHRRRLVACCLSHSTTILPLV